MNPYVDGFLLVVPRAQLDTYRAVAHTAGNIWREHGALDYVETVEDDLEQEGVKSFRERMGAASHEVVIFAWITYSSRVERDRINAAVMADPRLQKACPEGLLDMQRFHWGGFAPLVHLSSSAAHASSSAAGASTPTQKAAEPEFAMQVSTISAHLVCDPAAAAIDFYREAFGAQDLGRLAKDDGKLLHAMLRIGDSTLMLSDPFDGCPASDQSSAEGMLPMSPTMALHLYVPDVDEVVARAVAAGAEVVMPVADMFWGDRYGQLRDPFGHRWSVATHQRDVSEEEMKAAVREMFKA